MFILINSFLPNMPNKYQILVTNNNNSEKTNYLVFCDVPGASDNSGRIWTNVWAKTPGVGKNGGTIRIDITTEMFAVCGMAPEELGPCVNISTCDFIPVDLGPSDGAINAAIIEGGLMFDGDPGATEVRGGFEIRTETWTNAQYRKYSIPMARMFIQLTAPHSVRFLWYGQDSILFESSQSHPSSYMDCKIVRRLQNLSQDQILRHHRLVQLWRYCRICRSRNSRCHRLYWKEGNSCPGHPEKCQHRAQFILIVITRLSEICSDVPRSVRKLVTFDHSRPISRDIRHG